MLLFSNRMSTLKFFKIRLKTTHLCPKNLTFPKAERDQLCPRLVVVFCLFFSICQSDLLFAGLNQSNSYIEINKQKMATTKHGHC